MKAKKEIKMKVGFDFHGVVDKHTNIFRRLSERLISKNVEVHIITGQEWYIVKEKIKKIDVPYTHHFSIVDYHLEIGTNMWKSDKGTWWMEEYVWNRSKGDYIDNQRIKLHFDDSEKYFQYIPNFCVSVLVDKNFEEFSKEILGI